ncbi:MAG: glucose-1-phosphate thymidylyltransferase [Thermoplasmata archaeon]
MSNVWEGQMKVRDAGLTARSLHSGAISGPSEVSDNAGLSNGPPISRALLLAGGNGVRLRPLTSCRNKHMIPLANQPMILYALGHLSRAGIKEVGVVLGPFHEEIEAAIGDGTDFGMDITYLQQGEPRGLAHAVTCGRDFLGDDPFIMYLGDNLLQEGVGRVLDLYRRTLPDAAIAVTPVDDPRQYGVVELSGKKIVSIEEKPLEPRSNLALVGTYVFSSSVHAIIADLQPSGRGELEITDALRRLHEGGSPIAVQTLHGWWKDTGRHSDLLDANEQILRTMARRSFRIDGKVESHGAIESSVAVGEGSVIDAVSRVQGPSVIGRDVAITRGATVGPYSSIGDSVQVQTASVRRSIVMEGAQILGPLRITNSIIGRNARITARRPVDEEVSLTVGDSALVEL